MYHPASRNCSQPQLRKYCTSFPRFILKSYLLKLRPRCGASILAVHRQSFTQGYLQAVQQFFTRAFLAIDTRNLLDPTDPPRIVLLDDGSILRPHRTRIDIG
jgi:hypothetical protein